MVDDRTGLLLGTQALERTVIGGVIIGVQDERGVGGQTLQKRPYECRHAKFNGLGGDMDEERTHAQPIGGREGLCGESASAVRAAEALDADRVGGPEEESEPLGTPLWITLMEAALRVWAEGRPEGAACWVRESCHGVHARMN